MSLNSCILHDFLTTLYLVLTVHSISLGAFLLLMTSSSSSSSVFPSSDSLPSYCFSFRRYLIFLSSVASSASLIFSSFSSTNKWLLSAIRISSDEDALISSFLTFTAAGSSFSPGESSSSRSNFSGLLWGSGDEAWSVSSGLYTLS